MLNDVLIWLDSTRAAAVSNKEKTIIRIVEMELVKCSDNDPIAYD